MRSLHLYVTAAAQTSGIPDEPATEPGHEPLPPIRLGAWARWMAAREGGTGRPTGATPATQRAWIGIGHRSTPETAATD